MEKIYTIGFDKRIAEYIGGEFISVPALRDNEMHDWVIANLKREMTVLVVSLPADVEEMVTLFKIALHLRLSLAELKQGALVPIVFTSTQTLNQVIVKAKGYSHIFASVGSYFIAVDKIKTEVGEVQGILPHEYKTGFLEVVNILPEEAIGKHSLANIWGAHALDKAAKTKVFDSITSLNRQQQHLYLKFISAFNFDINLLKPNMPSIVGSVSLGQPVTIPAAGKKILLIDDEAEKGWDQVLKKIFKTSATGDFQVISQKVKDYESFSKENRQLIENGNFDLFLIDLRLNGLEEEQDIDPRDFSGVKVFKKIKELNRGNQTLILTASNKTWNLKYLLDEGANGYYLKESPEFNFSNKFTEKNYENFRTEVAACFHYSFLRRVDQIMKKCLGFILSDYPTRDREYQEFYDRAKGNLVIGFTLLEKSYQKQKYLSLAFLAFYQILEDYSNQEDNFCKDVTARAYYADYDKKAIDIDPDDWEWELEYDKTSGTSGFGYFKIGKRYGEYTPTSLAKISFILYLKFSKGNNELYDWAKLNNLRNTKAGHGTDNGEIELDEVFRILELVEMFLTRK
jgi:CheY-like chemotaxis protein